jgi:RHS repeat-associated protein
LSTSSFTIDAADRLSASGMTVDAFGRTTALPAGYATSGSAVTLGYYASDRVASINTGTQARSYGLDPAGNVRTVTATGVPAGTPTSTVHHYDGSGDSPTWTVDTASSGTVTTRFLDGLAGDPVATSTTGASSAITLNLVNLHGDVVRTTSPTATTAPDGQFNDADEFGVTRDAADPTGAATANGPRYGWLGAKQRAADTGAGLMLMGVRVYAPILGRFLQVAPVYGAGDTAYSYPNNPITMFDLDGRIPGWMKRAGSFMQRKAYGGYSFLKRNRRNIGRGLSVAALVGCAVVSGGACLAISAVAAGAAIYNRGLDTGVLRKRSKSRRYKEFFKGAAAEGVMLGRGYMIGRAVKGLSRSQRAYMSAHELVFSGGYTWKTW